jgi:hypothetical protein
MGTTDGEAATGAGSDYQCQVPPGPVIRYALLRYCLKRGYPRAKRLPG